MANYQLEICANSVQSAINAEIGGASRVELCNNLWEGGTTPSLAAIELAKAKVRIPVFVLIRPRGGDFVYSPLEFEQTKRDLSSAKMAGVDGIVAGVLLENGEVDIKRTAALVDLAAPLPFTFHRAFDLTPDPFKALEDVIACGAKSILTSGQCQSAEKGLPIIKNLIQKASGRITILPGGGINPRNITKFIVAGCTEFHLSAKTACEGKSISPNKVPINGTPSIPENEFFESDVTKVKSIVKILEKH